MKDRLFNMRWESWEKALCRYLPSLQSLALVQWAPSWQFPQDILRAIPDNHVDACSARIWNSRLCMQFYRGLKCENIYSESDLHLYQKTTSHITEVHWSLYIFSIRCLLKMRTEVKSNKSSPKHGMNLFYTFNIAHIYNIFIILLLFSEPCT